MGIAGLLRFATFHIGLPPNAALCRAVLAVCLVVLSSAPTAQTPETAYPTKPLRLVVPFGPGGIADLSARAVAERMSRDLKQAIVIDNKPGAGGVVAAEVVAKAEPDGQTLLLMSNANAVSVGLFRKLPFDTVRDFTPVGLLGTFDLVIVAGASAKFQTFAEMLAFAKANPDTLNIGTINIGSTQHLAAELFKTTTGIKAQVVPFNGTPAVISALRGGQIDMAVEILGPMLTQIQSGAMHALAVTGERRDPALRDVPTVREAGANYVVASWNALAVPAKTPPSAVARLNASLNAALGDPAVVNDSPTFTCSRRPERPPLRRSYWPARSSGGAASSRRRAFRASERKPAHRLRATWHVPRSCLRHEAITTPRTIANAISVAAKPNSSRTCTIIASRSCKATRHRCRCRSDAAT